MQAIRTEIPEMFFCPLTRKIMREPVLELTTGRTYEKKALMDGQPLSIVPNVTLRKAINEVLIRLARKVEATVVEEESTTTPLLPLPPPGSKIIIRTLPGREYDVAFNPNMTILELKEVIYEMYDLPVGVQRIIVSGKQLEDDRTIASYKIKANSVVFLNLRLRGGMLDPSSGRQDFSLCSDKITRIVNEMLDTFTATEEKPTYGGGGGGGGGGGEMI